MFIHNFVLVTNLITTALKFTLITPAGNNTEWLTVTCQSMGLHIAILAFFDGLHAIWLRYEIFRQTASPSKPRSLEEFLISVPVALVESLIGAESVNQLCHLSLFYAIGAHRFGLLEFSVFILSLIIKLMQRLLSIASVPKDSVFQKTLLMGGMFSVKAVILITLTHLDVAYSSELKSDNLFALSLNLGASFVALYLHYDKYHTRYTTEE